MSPRPKESFSYPDDFEEAWRVYPPRPGANKRDAFKAWGARLKDGYTPAEMLAGVIAYATYIKLTGTLPVYTKQPATFFGPALHFQTNWTGTGTDIQPPVLENGAVGLLQYYREERLV